MVPGWLQPQFQVCCSPCLRHKTRGDAEALCHCLFPDWTAQACWPSCPAAVWQCAVYGCLHSCRQLSLEPTEKLYPKTPRFIKSFPQWDHNHLYPVPSPGKWRLQGALAKKEAAIILITEMWLGWEGLLCLPTKHAICSSVSTSDWIYSLSER